MSVFSSREESERGQKGGIIWQKSLRGGGVLSQAAEKNSAMLWGKEKKGGA